MGLSGHIRFLGQRTDIGRILSAADIHLSASHTESLHNNILEAMSAGLPIIATKVGGVSELLADGVSGILVQARAPHQLAEAIEMLVGDRDFNAGLGTRQEIKWLALFRSSLLCRLSKRSMAACLHYILPTRNHDVETTIGQGRERQSRSSVEPSRAPACGSRFPLYFFLVPGGAATDMFFDQQDEWTRSGYVFRSARCHGSSQTFIIVSQHR